jgi:hypothetical protein
VAPSRGTTLGRRSARGRDKRRGREHRLRLIPSALVLGGTLVAAAWSPTGLAPTGAATPSRVIDRTLRCTIYPEAGAREIQLEAQPGIRDDANASQWTSSPSASAESYGLPNTIYGGLAALGAGSASHNRTRCLRARTRVPLRAAGLSGGEPSTFGDEWTCPAPRRVLVRLRAVFKEPVRLRLMWTDSTRRHREMTAEGSLVTGTFVIRAERGRAIAYASVSASGKVLLFTSSNCIPD